MYVKNLVCLLAFFLFLTTHGSSFAQQSASQRASNFRQEADRLQKQEKLTEAIENYTKAIELDPDDEDSYLGRGYAELALKHYRTAIADFDQVVRLYHVWEAKEKARKARGETAVTIQGLNFPELCSNAYNNRGIAKDNLGDNASACGDFRESCGLGNSLACENVKKVCNEESVSAQTPSVTSATGRQSTTQRLEGTWEGIQAEERYSPALDESLTREFFCSFDKQQVSCKVRILAASRVRWKRYIDPVTNKMESRQELIPQHLLGWEEKNGTYELSGNHIHIDLSAAYGIDATVKGNNMEGQITLKLESDQKARWVASKHNGEQR